MQNAESDLSTNYPTFLSTNSPGSLCYVVKNPLTGTVVKVDDCWPNWVQYNNKIGYGLRRVYYECGKRIKKNFENQNNEWKILNNYKILCIISCKDQNEKKKTLKFKVLKFGELKLYIWSYSVFFKML